MQISDVVGQSEVKDALISALAGGRLGHANLLSGPEGSGALALAVGFAQYLHCENRNDSESCGACDSCVKSKLSTHPDTHFIFPVVKNPKKKSDKTLSSDYLEEWREMLATDPYFSLDDWYQKMDAGNRQGIISVYESAELLRSLNLKSFQSAHKVFIIWMAEMMNTAAANKLLKALEEPPEGTVFLMICSREDLLLSTIRSRVQHYALSTLDEEMIRTTLIKENNIGDAEAQRIALIAGGNLNFARTLANSDQENQNWEQMFMEWMRMCFSIMRDFGGLLNWIETIAGMGRNSQKAFLSFCLEAGRECLLINYADDLKRYDDDSFPSLEKFAGYLNASNISDFSSEISEAIMAIERNANPKILFLDLSFRLSQILRSQQS